QGVHDGRVDHAGDVRREHHATTGVVERAGRPDADGRHAVASCDEPPGRGGHRGHDVLEAGLGRVDAHAVDDLAVRDDGREDLRAAQVDADGAHCVVPPARPAASTAWAAIMLSSSVLTASTATALPGALTTGPPAAFAAGSSSMPRKRRPSSAAARITASF